MFHLLHRGEQGVAQGSGIVGGQKKSAGFVGQAAQAALVLLADIETDNVNGKIRPAHGQFGRQFAWVDVTGLQSVAYQHHRGSFFSVAQGFGRLAYGFAQGGFALGTDALHLGLHGRRVVEPHWHHHFNVITVSFAAVAVYDEPCLKVFGNLIDEISQHLFGNSDLALALDLAPHGAGAVQHQHHAAGNRTGNG